MRVLSSLKARPLGASQLGKLCLDLFRLLTAVAQGDQVVGVPDQHRGAPAAVSAPPRLALEVADPGGRPPSRAGRRSSATG